MKRGKKAERIVLLVAALVAVVGVVQAVAGAVQIGVTVDEPTHVDRTKSWIESGFYVPSLLMENGTPTDAAGASPNLYGPAFSAIAQAATYAVGWGALDEVVTTSGAWKLRHLLTALLGVAGALAAALAVFSITRSKLFTTWAFAAMLATPLWLGMSFFNLKDIPVATGYTFFTVGLLVACVLVRSQGRIRPPAGIGITALIATGVLLSVGTRLAMWVPLTLALIAYLAIILLGSPGARGARLSLGYALGGLVLGGVGLLLLYPAVLLHPLEALRESALGSSDFPWTGYTLTAGELLDEDTPSWYLPAWTVASVPLVTLALATAAIVIGVITAIRRAGATELRGLAGRLAGSREAPVVLVFLQATLLPLGSIAVGATMYTGMRQFLFVVPALVILAAVGAAWLWKRARRPESPPLFRPILAGLLCAVLAIPMVEQSLLFPFNYTYVTPVAGIGGVNGRWETDFWWASSREAQSRIPLDREAMCRRSSFFGGEGKGLQTSSCYAGYESFFGPFADERRAPIGTPARNEWVILKNRSPLEPPERCDTSESVTRWLRGEQVVMSYVLRCPLDDADPGITSATASIAR